MATNSAGGKGAGTHDLFGETPRAEAATPGSYGLRPAGYRLPEATRLGPVRLRVADLERSLAYYEEVLGLRRLDRSGSWARLGAPGADGGAPTSLVELEERRGVSPARGRGRTGLFHFALRLPERGALGRFVRHLDAIAVRAGAADHLVSEAFYLQDPDNLGIEVYADRPRAEWRRVGRELMMATDPIDLGGLLDAAGPEPWRGAPAGTSMGHVHLHVGDLELARAFYADALGFDRTVWDYPGALFFGAGGYHHHVGTNLWAGRDATPPAEDEAQLLDWTIELPSDEALEEVVASLERGGHAADDSEGAGVGAADPWGTRVRLHTAAAGGE